MVMWQNIYIYKTTESKQTCTKADQHQQPAMQQQQQLNKNENENKIRDRARFTYFEKS